MPTSNSGKRPIVITMGDPSGVGPEVALKALADRRVRLLTDFLIIGDRSVLERSARRLGLKLDLPILDLANVPPRNFSYGRSSPLFGKASIEYIDKAVELLQKGRARALVTAPINKASVVAAGFAHFQGHTEYLAAKTRTKDAVMMFVGADLKITLVTRHIALKDVPKALSPQAIITTILLTHTYLKKYFGIKDPRIGVAGLNPHAGDGGLFGDEEARVIAPAIRAVSRKLSGVSGPMPPDALFYELLNKNYDAAVALYHDQGLIPFKLLYFKTGVNLTLGLPFVRTSPDHGTAFDIAGDFMADHSSMAEAILLACKLSKATGRRKK